jgi:hypothetical protein
MPATHASWKHIPFAGGVPIRFEATFSHDEFEKLSEGLIPEAMEDKWVVFFEAPHLFVHRSWTGEPVYRVTLSNQPLGVTVVEALAVERDVEATSPDYAAQLLDFLISNLLLGRSTPFPLPPGAREAHPGLLQHAMSGTSYPHRGTLGRWRWWWPWRAR